MWRLFSDVRTVPHSDSLRMYLSQVYLHYWIFMKCVAYSTAQTSTKALLWSIRGVDSVGLHCSLSVSLASLAASVMFPLLLHSVFIYRHWWRYSCGAAAQRRALNCRTAPPARRAPWVVSSRFVWLRVDIDVLCTRSTEVIRQSITASTDNRIYLDHAMPPSPLSTQL